MDDVSKWVSEHPPPPPRGHPKKSKKNEHFKPLVSLSGPVSSCQCPLFFSLLLYTMYISKHTHIAFSIPLPGLATPHVVVFISWSAFVS
ncbi:hypothetical protein GDO81_024094 [Engystomops pustulosus]|uniref:Transmembrane protein n=1 Tax=Engystomops pustulosus TaxID=76066 RepID=A0AAV6YS14_ENGPU|nr:hypothetical protein GDO81_024094 [Engystomops pustulosus]